jgi:hypothetical protein
VVRWVKARIRRIAVAATLLALAASVVGGAALLRSSPSRPPSPAAEEDFQAEEQISRCRLYSAVEQGIEPDWLKAEIACNRVLDLHPIHEEANRLLLRIKDEQAAFERLRRVEALEALDELSALELLTQVPETSTYFRRAKAQALEMRARAMPRLQADCARLLRRRPRSPALLTCEKYLALACQDAFWRERNLGAGASLPPAGAAADQLYLQFLRVRQAASPSSATWICPQLKLLEERPELESDAKVSEALLQRSSDRRVGQAVLTYWRGNLPAALSALQACLHRGAADPSTARQLQSRISMVMQLLKAGHTALQARDPENAAAPFRAALEHDRQILGPLTLPASSVERIIRREMSSHSYQRGKYWADRADTHRACRIWKVGYSFSRGDLALLQAVKHCSERGRELVAAAHDCAELASAADLAVEGDGMLEKVRARREELGCR